MKARITTAWHLPTKTPKHISEVENGAKCECTCFECRSPLIAANRGKIQEHHFKHRTASSCKGSPETGLHLLAKRIIKESSEILISEGFELKYINVIEEERFEDITPDVQIKSEFGEVWFVEIAVTHFIDSVKLEKLKKLNINCLEIDLSRTDRFIDISELKELVLNDSNTRKIITQKSYEPQIVEIEEQVKEKGYNFWPWIIGGTALIIAAILKLKKR